MVRQGWPWMPSLSSHLIVPPTPLLCQHRMQPCRGAFSLQFSYPISAREACFCPGICMGVKHSDTMCPAGIGQASGHTRVAHPPTAWYP